MYSDRISYLADLENLINKDIYVICTTNHEQAMLDPSMMDVLRKTLKISKKRPSAALIIETRGGDASTSFYICELFREYYDCIDSYIATDCYSGGSIIALSTDNIYVSSNGCLGAIDVQIMRSVSKNNVDSVWYPNLAGKIDALVNASEKNLISDILKDSFPNTPAILAEYFQEKLTYENLVGDNIKKHCVDASKYSEIFKFLTSINFSHSNALTYKKLIDIGLDVQRMPEAQEALIIKILNNIEYDFGNLNEKSIFSRFYENKDTEIIDSYSIVEDKKTIEVKVSKIFEPLSIIETPRIGFIQRIETALTSKNNVPENEAIPISVGWIRESDYSLMYNDKKCASKIVKFFAKYDSDYDYSNNPEFLDEFCKVLYNEAIKNIKFGVDNLSNSEINSIVYKFLKDRFSMSLQYIFQNNAMRRSFSKFIAQNNINYKKLDFHQRISCIDVFLSTCKKR